ncbi:hypothetical protein BB558_002416 [Smittium angustum]|uniref:Protein disulfide-isomerase n=2 Tax=Smittium angustum TaxID=133377 RepID=A0A2U1J8Z1_SMIAN|nr:hypothetical protein BB558_002416 [Smittium angustum]
MKLQLLKFGLFGALSLITPTVLAEDSDVKVLNEKNFDEWISQAPLSLVEFYAPWCGHCKTLAPEYEVAASKLKENKINLGKIDCTVETTICDKYNIKGFPTLYVFKDGQHLAYNGTRKSDGIISYMKKQNLPSITAIPEADFESFIASDKIVVVGAFNPESKELETLKKIADVQKDEYTFGYVTDSEFIKKNKLETPSITIYKTFGKPETFKGEFDQEAITKFISLASVQTLGEINRENYMNYMKSGLPIGYLFYNSKEMRQKLESELMDAATKHRSSFHFVLIDASVFGAMAKGLNLKEEWPAFAIQEPKSGAKYVFSQEQDITSEALDKFSQGVVDGTVKKSIKSEPIPKDNSAPVKVVVADEFEKIVMDTKKDVLIEFYAPWCGHCKKLEPTYTKLGELSSKFDNLVIAKMDATENDIPVDNEKFNIAGFPTIMLVKGGSNDIVEYTGTRAMSSIISFIELNSNTKMINTIEWMKQSCKKGCLVDESKYSVVHDRVMYNPNTEVGKRSGPYYGRLAALGLADYLFENHVFVLAMDNQTLTFGNGNGSGVGTQNKKKVKSASLNKSELENIIKSQNTRSLEGNKELCFLLELARGTVLSLDTIVSFMDDTDVEKLRSDTNYSKEIKENVKNTIQELLLERKLNNSNIPFSSSPEKPQSNSSKRFNSVDKDIKIVFIVSDDLENNNNKSQPRKNSKKQTLLSVKELSNIFEFPLKPVKWVYDCISVYKCLKLD